MNMEQNMKKRVLITGGSRGIGASCVELFSSLGHNVAFVYKSNADKAKECEKKTGAFPICADLSTSDGVRYAIDKAIEILGGIDILVNNAGVSIIGLVNDMSDSEWYHILNSNLSSAFLMSREASKYMISQHSGCIVNIGSVWGRCGASCEVAYSSTKAAMRGLTLSLAKELGPSGIRVNCVEPGVILTDMNASHTEETMKELCEETPLMRLGTPDDVARAVHFLTSDDASFITAQILGVDGGFGI